MLIKDNMIDEEIIAPYLKTHNIVGLLKHIDGSRDVILGCNLVVTTGTNYYAQLINQDTPTNTFIDAYLGNPVGDDSIAAADDFSDWVQGTLLVSTEKAASSTGLNNLDTDNTGKGEFIYTWKFEWGASDFNTEGGNDVRTGIISITGAMGTDPILNHWNFSVPFEKLSTSSLTLWVNHNLVGV